MTPTPKRFALFSIIRVDILRRSTTFRTFFSCRDFAARRFNFFARSVKFRNKRSIFSILKRLTRPTKRFVSRWKRDRSRRRRAIGIARNVGRPRERRRTPLVRRSRSALNRRGSQASFTPSRRDRRRPRTSRFRSTARRFPLLGERGNTRRRIRCGLRTWREKSSPLGLRRRPPRLGRRPKAAITSRSSPPPTPPICAPTKRASRFRSRFRRRNDVKRRRAKRRLIRG